MTHHAFICYPSHNQDIVENLAGRLRDIGLQAWVYSLDRALAADTVSLVHVLTDPKAQRLSGGIYLR